ncbi:hypothetical protein ACNPQM_33535, partial [Streptomyces sp. NPDC056231]|uniref:hypothetical protein n=1 Tax=Streptomyces sp. NPDC056231 TaxID=3345755 RepID=UPI003AAD9A4E
MLAGDSERVIADIRTAAKTAVLGEDKLKTIEAVCGYLESKSLSVPIITSVQVTPPTAVIAVCGRIGRRAASP